MLSRLRSGAVTAAVALLVSAGLGAQDERARDLARAWLGELLDRDPQAALQTYEALADSSVAEPIRQIAQARRMELTWVREDGERPPRRSLPRGARGESPLATAQFLDHRRAIQTALAAGPGGAAGLEAAREALRAWVDQAGPLEPRPLTRLALNLATQPNPNPRDVAVRRLERNRSYHLLRLRLDGRHEQADRLVASLPFRRASRPARDEAHAEPPAAALARAERQLAEMLANDRGLSSDERALLERLAARLARQRSAGEIEPALALLRSLPLIGDRLLAPR